jgi:hypothetical protein
MTYAEANAAGKLKESATWWIAYRANGRLRHESSGSDKEVVAKRLLKLREGATAEGKVIPLRGDRITVGELAKDLELEYKTNGRRSAKRLRYSLARLLPFFGNRRAAKVTSADVTRFIAQRQQEGAAGAALTKAQAYVAD